MREPLVRVRRRTLHKTRLGEVVGLSRRHPLRRLRRFAARAAIFAALAGTVLGVAGCAGSDNGVTPAEVEEFLAQANPQAPRFRCVPASGGWDYSCRSVGPGRRLKIGVETDGERPIRSSTLVPANRSLPPLSSASGSIDPTWREKAAALCADIDEQKRRLSEPRSAEELWVYVASLMALNERFRDGWASLRLPAAAQVKAAWLIALLDEDQRLAGKFLKEIEAENAARAVALFNGLQAQGEAEKQLLRQLGC